ncbi:Protein of unknown function [Gryllus bimaculatus]|nr:Protein of unknown function [Gryllus bimaculatus]
MRNLHEKVIIPASVFLLYALTVLLRTLRNEVQRMGSKWESSQFQSHLTLTASSAGGAVVFTP